MNVPEHWLRSFVDPKLSPEKLVVEAVPVRPRKGDTSVDELILLWVPEGARG